MASEIAFSKCFSSGVGSGFDCKTMLPILNSETAIKPPFRVSQVITSIVLTRGAKSVGFKGEAKNIFPISSRALRWVTASQGS